MSQAAVAEHEFGVEPAESPLTPESWGKLGMWVFLAADAMSFGGLLAGYGALRYGDDALVNFYHGFHQTGRMDRQELRLVFERGDLTLFDWVPTRARVHAVVDERQNWRD